MEGSQHQVAKITGSPRTQLGCTRAVPWIAAHLSEVGHCTVPRGWHRSLYSPHYVIWAQGTLNPTTVRKCPYSCRFGSSKLAFFHMSTNKNSLLFAGCTSFEFNGLKVCHLTTARIIKAYPAGCLHSPTAVESNQLSGETWVSCSNPSGNSIQDLEHQGKVQIKNSWFPVWKSTHNFIPGKVMHRSSNCTGCG